MKFNTNKFYITPLYAAIRRNNKEIVSLLLLRKDLDVNLISIQP